MAGEYFSRAPGSGCARSTGKAQKGSGVAGVCRQTEECRQTKECRQGSKPCSASPPCAVGRDRRERGVASPLRERELCHGCCRCGVFRGKILRPAHCNSPREAAEVPRLQGTLDRPQNDAEQDDDQGGEEDYAFPVVAHVAAGQPPSYPRRGSLRSFWLAHGDVDGDARVRVLGVIGCLTAAELGPFHPEHLLLLEFGRQRGEELFAGLECWGTFQRDAGQLPAEGTGELVLWLIWGQPRAQAGHALQAENVGALEQLGRLEGVVVGVEANGTLDGGGRLRRRWVRRARLVGWGPPLLLAIPWGGDNNGADGDGDFTWRCRDWAGGRVGRVGVPQLREARHDGGRRNKESPGRL